MFEGQDTRTVVEWFDLGGSLPLSDISSADEVIAQTRGVQGLRELAERAGVAAGRDRARRGVGDRLRARRSLRAEEDQPQRRTRLLGRRAGQRRRPARREEPTIDEEVRIPGGKKKYYN